MPLSEHEQRLLDQIERALYQEDPKFASTVRQTDLRSHMRRRLRNAGLVLTLGFILLLAGVVTSQPLVGVAGFVVMVGSLLLAMSSWKRLGQGPELQVVDGGGAPSGSGGSRPARGRKGGKPKSAKPRGQGSMKNRLEERWNKRWDERGR